MEQYSSKPVLLNILDDNVLSGDDNFDAEANFGDFCDEGGVDLVMDTRDEAYTKRFTCAMLVNATQITEGVETELYNLGPSHHMTAYRNCLEKFISESIATAEKPYFQPTGKKDL